MTATSYSTRPTAAALNMLGAMAIIGFIDTFVVVIAETMSVWQFLVGRMVMAVPLVLLASAIGLGTVRPRRWRPVILRSCLFAFGMFCYFGALGFMPIALALAGLFTSPVFVLLITAFWLRRRVGPWRIAAVLTGFVGILMTLGPSGGALGWIIALPVLGGALYAAGVVATRALCEGESTLTLLIGIFIAQGTFGLMVLGGLTIVPVDAPAGTEGFLLRGWVWPLGDAWGPLLLQVFGSVVGVGLLNRAYQLGEASRIAVFEYSVMIFGPFFGWWLMGQTLGSMQLAGIVLIALAGIIIALRSDAA